MGRRGGGLGVMDRGAGAGAGAGAGVLWCGVCVVCVWRFLGRGRGGLGLWIGG